MSEKPSPWNKDANQEFNRLDQERELQEKQRREEQIIDLKNSGFDNIAKVVRAYSADINFKGHLNIDRKDELKLVVKGISDREEGGFREVIEYQVRLLNDQLNDFDLDDQFIVAYSEGAIEVTDKK